MYQKIMVPLDGSQLAECVLSHLESIAKGCGAKNVVFVRAVEPFYMPTGGDAVVFSQEDITRIEAGNKKEAQDYLAGIVSRNQYPGVNVEAKVLSGRPADTLADFATKNNVDLILICTHGRSGVSRWVWGSTADRLLRSSCVPVHMIRAPGCVPGI